MQYTLLMRLLSEGGYSVVATPYAGERRWHQPATSPAQFSECVTEQLADCSISDGCRCCICHDMQM